ncbi:MAG: trypsin-like peptidase domain-containing protein [Curtobacterium sp.]
MNETPNPDATPGGTNGATTDGPDARTQGVWEAPHADRSTLRPAYAFDGRGPYLVGSPALDGQHWSNGQGGPNGHGWSNTQGWATGAAAANHNGWGSTTTKRPRRLGLVIGSGIAALAILGAAGGTALGLSSQHTSTTSSQSQGTTTLPGTGSGSSDGSGTNGFTVPGNGLGTGDGTGQGSTSDGSSGTSTQSAATAATAAQKKGVVTINTVLNYDESSQAAGTGMILTSDGTVLTNNHVVQGATSIVVTDETTGKQYKADVVGTDATHDVAVLKLQDASGLSTVTLDDDGGAKTGDAVTDVGNAEGTGNLVAAEGTVTATDQDIQVQSDSGSGTESLTGMIQVAADIVSGDSGGPVLDSEGEVVGMATAASSGTADVTGFAIPISTAKSIADKILAGESSSTITIGLPAFLGVEVSGTATTGGVAVAGTVEGSGAAKAGLGAGDVVTALDGGHDLGRADEGDPGAQRRRPGDGDLHGQRRDLAHRDHHADRGPGRLAAEHRPHDRPEHVGRGICREGGRPGFRASDAGEPLPLGVHDRDRVLRPGPPQVRDRPRRAPEAGEPRVALGDVRRQVRRGVAAVEAARHQVCPDRPRAEREGPHRADAEPPGHDRDHALVRGGGDHLVVRPVDDGAVPGLEARLAPVGQPLFQRGRLGVLGPGAEEGLRGLGQGAEPSDEAGVDELAAGGAAQESGVPPSAGEAPEGRHGLGGQPRAVELGGGGRVRQDLEVTARSCLGRLGRADGVEHGEHEVVRREHAGQRTLDREVHPVPSGDEDEVGSGDRAVLVGADVLDESSGGARGGPDVDADEQQSLDGPRETLEEARVLLGDRAVARAAADGQHHVVAGEPEVGLRGVLAAPGVRSAEREACGAVLGAERDGDCHASEATWACPRGRVRRAGQRAAASE